MQVFRFRLAKGTDYEVLDARYDSADASQEEKTISFTVKLKNKGYVFEDGTTQKDFTLNGAELDDKSFKINQATVPMNNPAEITLFVLQRHVAKTYTLQPGHTPAGADGSLRLRQNPAIVRV